MATRAVLDSSPIVPSKSAATSGIPPPKRPLKRSASTASLPTPPQTDRHDRYSRSRSRGSDHGTDTATDEEEDEEASGTRNTSRSHKGGKRLNFGRKKQRTDSLDATIGALSGEDLENPFWDGLPVVKSFQNAKNANAGHEGHGREEDKQSPERSPSPAVPALLKFRARAPISPPPSRRQSTQQVPVVVPTTPERAVSKKVGAMSVSKAKHHPIRDSPNNPFLEDSPDSAVGEPIEPQTPTAHEEKPTISYVFRGVRTTYANPLFGLSPSAHERSLLPVDHPDFSPSQVCPPKLLFPEVQRRRRRRSLSSSPTRTSGKKSVGRKGGHEGKGEIDAWSESDEELRIEPPKNMI